MGLEYNLSSQTSGFLLNPSLTNRRYAATISENQINPLPKLINKKRALGNFFIVKVILESNKNISINTPLYFQ